MSGADEVAGRLSAPDPGEGRMRKLAAHKETSALPITTHTEELANSFTGGLGLIASVIGLSILIGLNLGSGDTEALLSGAVYGSTLVLLFIATTAYHWVDNPRWKPILRVLDHCAVYLLIAGTYTPVAIAAIGGRTGWYLLAATWMLAVIGIVFKLVCRFRFPATSVTFYILMGWLGLAMIGPLLDALPLFAVALLALSGLTFTLGALFFGAKWLPYNHAAWHVCVIAGCVLSYLAITGFVLLPG